MARLSRLLLLGGLAAGAAYALRNKQQVSGLVDSVTPSPSTPKPAPKPAEAPEGVAASEPGPAPAPAVANADADGPPENTSTHVPAPDPQVHEPEGGIDEEAEEAAAAAEAANIGGTPEDYPSEEDPTIPTDEALRPLEEAGEGYSEGQELAEADLADNAEAAAGDPIEAERQIDEIIEAQDDPAAGESDEAVEQLGLADEAESDLEAETLGDAPPPSGEPAIDLPPPPETSPSEKSSAVWRLDDQPTVEAEAVEEDDGPARTEDGA